MGTSDERGWSRREVVVGGAVGLGLALSGRALGEESPQSESGFASSAKLENRVDDMEAPGVADFEQRIERARRAMADNGLDALFVEATPSLGYFTGISWWPSERVFGVVIPKKGDVAYVSPAFEEGRAREHVIVGKDVRTWQENESPYRRIAEILRDRGLATGKLGVDPASRFFVFDGLRKELTGAQVVDGAPVVQACRGRKDAGELALMRRANEITEAAIAQATAGLHEGATQAEVSAAVQAGHVAQGAGPGWALVLFGPNAAYPHGTDASYRLQLGDLVLMDCGTSVHGYQSDITRTVAFGRAPSDRQREIWDVVQRAQQAAFAKARPGLPCGEVDHAARAVIEAAGFGPGYRTFTHRLGHGIGMEGHEWPYLVQDNKLPLAPGMTFSDEPGIYLVGELGVRLEDILCITEDGCEFLSRPLQELPVVGV